ncbi:MAG: hypothetical protein HGA86_04345, partial [Anaerolineaceae bacterium]|nr:hypothetical protein [Anaerolineaceae bacterium]
MQIAGSVSKRYLFIEALLILCLSYLLLLDAGNQSLSVYPVNLFSAILFSLITLIWLFFGQKGGNPVVLPVAIWVIVSLIATIFSIDPRRSLSELVLASISIFIFFLVFDLVKW